MSYGVKIDEADRRAQNALIATKILDLMDKLRLGANEAAKRRWIWELLQNAKDVAFDNEQIAIEINIQDEGGQKSVSFSHNGKPFSVDNITFLIKQVSTKERTAKANSEKPKTTGKFGTGFLTTHLLSEKVEVSGVIKEPDLDFKKFVLPLDRSGRTLEGIVDSVNSSLKVLRSLDTLPSLSDYHPSYFNTSFRYNLDDEGQKVAKVGVDDLHLSLPFTLAFLPSIKFVTIKHENTIYELGEIENESGNIQIVTIFKKTTQGTKEIKIVMLGKNATKIAVEIEKLNGKTYVKGFSDELPKLFCDFPLIGTHDFTLPIIINSSTFNPTEPRDGIFLTDLNNESKIRENKQNIQDSVELYFELLEYASKKSWEHLFYLAITDMPKEKEWFSKPWLKLNFQEPIRHKILKTPILENSKGTRITFLSNEGKPSVWFPFSKDEEVRNRIWELCMDWIPEMLPKREEIHQWYDVIWGDCPKLTLKVIAKSIQDKKTITGILEMLDCNEDEGISWLNSFYELMNLEGEFIEKVIGNEFAIIPNQNGVLKKINELSVDRDIEEELKNTLSILGSNWRDLLVHKKVRTGERLPFFEKTQDNIIYEINRIIKAGENENISEACDYLSSCFSDDTDFPSKQTKIYEFCQALWDMPGKRQIVNWSENIWQEVNKLQINWLIQTISECETISKLQERLELEEHDTLEWLNLFIEFLINNGYEDRLNLPESPILPNQNGHFCLKDDLFLDDGEIDDTLKDILESLGYELREELLDLLIYLNLPKNRERDQGFVADEISKLVKQLFAEFPRSPETKQIFKSLYLWFSKNKSVAEKVFDELFRNKHKLYDDDEIAENMEKAERLDEILSTHGITIEQLKIILEKGKLNDEMNENLIKANISVSIQDTLIILGISTTEELKEALNDSTFYNQFRHISSASIEMLENVMLLIERAKKNVKEYLSQLHEYDIIGWREVSKTVISGILKDGKEISIVVRPSDGGYVIFYYDSEKDTLEQSSSELWIDDNIKVPQQLTLGRVLKRNRIDRISV